MSNNIPPTSSPPKDIGEVEKLVSEGKVAAVFVEPIHGNGGIKSFTPQYLQSLRTACDKSGVLLAFDEVNANYNLYIKLTTTNTIMFIDITLLAGSMWHRSNGSALGPPSTRCRAGFYDCAIPWYGHRGSCGE